MKIALITDSTSDISPEEAKANDITVVPIPVIIGDKQYMDGVDITAEKLFELERDGAPFPKTSQPSPGTMLELCQKLKNEGYEVYAPIMKYCTDNASMVASSAYFFNNTFDNIDVEVFSRV